MKQTTALTALIAAFPSYAALFVTPPAAGLMLGSSTIALLVITGMTYSAKFEDNYEQKIALIRMACLIHIVGMMINIAFHNL